MEEDDFFEEDVFEELDAFFVKQVGSMRYASDKIATENVSFKQWEVLSGEDVEARHHPVPQQQKVKHRLCHILSAWS